MNRQLTDNNSRMNTRIAQIVGLIDLTNLAEDCDHSAIDQLCSMAVTPIGPVAAICIWPKFVKQVHQHLAYAEYLSLIHI